jgi:hypothetical protein
LKRERERQREREKPKFWIEGQDWKKKGIKLRNELKKSRKWGKIKKKIKIMDLKMKLKKN